MQFRHLLYFSALFLLMFSCKAEGNQSGDKSGEKQTELKQGANGQFQVFLDHFKEVIPPFSASDEQAREWAESHEMLPAELVEQFICDQEISQLTCTPEAKESFSPVCRISTNHYYMVFYNRGSSEGGITYLASYSPEGELISRLPFAGTNYPNEGLSGDINRDISEISTLWREFTEGMRGDESSVELEVEKTYRILASGEIEDQDTGKIVKDKLQ